MALDKIRKANKKARHERKRRGIRESALKKRQGDKVRRHRARNMIIQGRQEMNAARRAGNAYVKKLESELVDEQT